MRSAGSVLALQFALPQGPVGISVRSVGSVCALRVQWVSVCVL